MPNQPPGSSACHHREQAFAVHISGALDCDCGVVEPLLSEVVDVAQDRVHPSDVEQCCRGDVGHSPVVNGVVEDYFLGGGNPLPQDISAVLRE